MLIAGQLPGLRAQDVRAREQAYGSTTSVSRGSSSATTGPPPTRSGRRWRTGRRRRLRASTSPLPSSTTTSSRTPKREARAASAAQPNAPPAALCARPDRARRRTIERCGRAVPARPRHRRQRCRREDSARPGADRRSSVRGGDRAARAGRESRAVQRHRRVRTGDCADTCRPRRRRAHRDGALPAAPRQSAAITYATTYLAQGRYAEAIVSTGLEAELVETKAPDTGFTDVTDAVLGRDSARERLAISLATGMPPLPFGVTLADVDGDAGTWICCSSPATPSRSARTTAAGSQRRRSSRRRARCCLSRRRRLRQRRPRRSLCARPAGLPAVPPGGRRQLSLASRRRPGSAPAGGARAAAFVDVDHDGDLDVVIGAPGGGGARLFRNNGNGRFSDATSDARLSVTARTGRLTGVPRKRQAPFSRRTRTLSHWCRRISTTIATSMCWH